VGSISGKVFCEEDCVYGATVEALQDGEVIRMATTDGGGTYQIVYLDPGNYDVRCGAYRIEREAKKATVTRGEDTSGINFMLEGVRKVTVVDVSRHYLGRDPRAVRSFECRFSMPDVSAGSVSLWFRGVGIWGYGDYVLLNGKTLVHLNDLREDRSANLPAGWVEIPLRQKDVLRTGGNVVRFLASGNVYQVWDIVLVEYAPLME
jgi:hypothetical protein